MESFEVPTNLDGARLDQALAALAGHSRRKVRDLIQKGGVYLDGRRCRTASRAVRAGARLGVEEGQPQRQGEPETRTIWSGQGILVLDKPGGIAFAPTRSAVEGTVLHALAKSLAVPLKALFPVHRLDTPTSGAVLVALNAATAAFLSEAFAEGRIRKTYLAWVRGAPEPPEGSWDMPLAAPRGGVVRVSVGGRAARTLYRVIRREDEVSLLELRPRTGRTHQLRVHSSSAGFPILGDRKYGGPSAGARRALLHAWEITFPLPDGGEVTVRAPLPADMDLTGDEVMR